MNTDRRIRLRQRWSIGIRVSGLSTKARAVAWALATFMDPNGVGACPSGETLGAAAGLPRSSVYKHLKVLEDAGWIKRTGGGGRGLTTSFAPVIPPWIELLIEQELTARKPSQERDGFGPETVSGDARNRLSLVPKPSHQLDGNLEEPQEPAPSLEQRISIAIARDARLTPAEEEAKGAAILWSFRHRQRMRDASGAA